MIRMNYYVRNNTTVSTADLLRGAATTLTRVADSLDKPNDVLAMLNEVFDVVTRDKIADKVDQIQEGLAQMALELRGPVIDQRSIGFGPDRR
jgi:hypothetical protein